MAPTRPKPHPNRAAFEGILARINQPSDMPVGGAMGHRTLITMEAAQNGLESLEGMGLGFREDLEAHDHRHKCGVLTRAWIDGDAIWVGGHLYLHDFPELGKVLRKPGSEFGMSYEIAVAEIEDMRDPVWRVTRCIFSGAALLLRHKAAYRKTLFNLTASAEQDDFTGKLVLLTEEPLHITLD